MVPLAAGIGEALIGVALGRWLAVEAAALLPLLLGAAGTASGHLRPAQWKLVLDDPLSLSGALFALLVGFTTFALVLPALSAAAWVAALVLLVLQTGYLLPPLGYTVVVSRRLMLPAPAIKSLARALAPQLLGQVLGIAAVLAWPQTTLWLRSEAQALAKPAPTGDADALMQEAINAQQVQRKSRPGP